jgi:hypothetical protein
MHNGLVYLEIGFLRGFFDKKEISEVTYPSDPV